LLLDYGSRGYLTADKPFRGCNEHPKLKSVVFEGINLKTSDYHDGTLLHLLGSVTCKIFLGLKM
jgi:hypothetical protein